MPIESTGAVSLGTSAGANRSISGEFGGTVPHALSEYKAGGGLVPSGTAGIPTTNNNIRMGLFLGSSAAIDTQTVTVGYLSPGQYNGEAWGYQNLVFTFGSISDGTADWLSGNLYAQLQFSPDYDTVSLAVRAPDSVNAGFTSMTVDGQTFSRSSASYTYTGNAPNGFRYWSWSTATNPFGTTVGATRTVTFS